MKAIFFLLVSFLVAASLDAFIIEEYAEAILKLKSNATFVKDFDNYINYLLSIDPKYFEGKKLSDFKFDNKLVKRFNKPATSVHELKPSDIKVIAALGDSITAAFGAKATSLTSMFYEYRGVSWTMGGDKDSTTTLPNILKLFNPNLKGYSTSYNFALFGVYGNGLNVAASGNDANHIPGQIETLIKRLKASKEFDWQNDWKLINLFIGGNDLCHYFRFGEWSRYSPQNYIKNIEKGLDMLHKELPKTFVNFVMILDISELKLVDNDKPCTSFLKVECPYIAFPPSAKAGQEIMDVTVQYQNLTEQLINSGKYDTRDDFTVVVQPFMKDFKMPRLPNGKIDYSYLAPDCFHFSTKTHGNIILFKRLEYLFFILKALVYR